MNKWRKETEMSRVIYFLWTFSLGSISVGNDPIYPHVSRFARPHKTHVAHVLLIGASPRPEGEQFRVSTGRNTWYSKPWNYPGGSPRGAVVSRTPSRAPGRAMSLLRSRVECHSLLNTTVTSVSRYFNSAFRVKTVRAYPPHRDRH